MTCERCACGFWVTTEEEYCLNCGKIRAGAINANALSERGKIGVIQPTAPRYIGGAVGLSLGLLSASLGVGFAGGVIGWFAGEAAYRKGIDAWLRQRKLNALKQRAGSSLQQDVRTIEQRIAELGARKEKITAFMQEMAREQSTAHIHAILTTLKSALAALNAQVEQYREKLQEIEFIRWHNTLQPLFLDRRNLTLEKCDQHLTTLAATQKRGDEIAQGWEQRPGAAAKRLREALTACGVIRQDLFAQKAATLVKGIGMLQETIPANAGTLQQIDALHTLVDVGEFSSGLKTLEDEYFRLKSEEEVRQEFRA